MEILQFKPTNKKEKNKKISLIIIASILIIAGIIIASLYVTDENFREKFDIYILRKEITENSVAQIMINSNENQHICAYDKYIGILNKSTLILYDKSGKSKIVDNPTIFFINFSLIRVILYSRW